MFAAQFFRRTLLLHSVITISTVLLHPVYHPQGITMKIFPIPAVITVVTIVLLLFSLPCHPLVCQPNALPLA